MPSERKNFQTALNKGMDMKRKILVLLFASLTLAACQPDLIDLGKTALGINKKTDQDAANKIDENVNEAEKRLKNSPTIEAHKTHVLQQAQRIQTALNQTPQLPADTTVASYDPKIDYQAYPAKQQKIFYFDKDSKNIDKKQKDGYFRKVLGETADGLIVVQDFYANGQAQIAPALTKRGGDLRDFNADQSEGVVVWFDEQGKIEQAADFKFGKVQGYTAYYADSKLLGFMDIPHESRLEWVVTYPNGKVAVWRKINTVTNEIESAAWYADGKPAVFGVSKDGQYQVAVAWKKNGDLELGKQPVSAEIIALDQQVDDLIKHVFKDFFPEKQEQNK